MLLNLKFSEYDPDCILPYVDRSDLQWHIWGEDLEQARV